MRSNMEKRLIADDTIIHRKMWELGEFNILQKIVASFLLIKR